MTETWPKGYTRTILDEVTSTLDVARSVAAQAVGPEWILAHKQTKARGRRGRAWHQPPGNFAASLVIPVSDEAPNHIALRSFVTSLALCDAVQRIKAAEDHLALKWPNDLLLNGGKLAGILLETVGPAAAPSHVIIGIGVNLAGAPPSDQLEPGAVQPTHLGGAVRAEPFLDILAQSYAEREQQFMTFGFEPIRRAWLAQAAKLGETITARMTRETLHGVFRDVDSSGQLRLETATGTRTIPAADIYF